jgi:hypothetical protein
VLEGSFHYRAPSESQPHLEAETGTPCAPVHNDLACQVCRVAGQDLIGSPRVAPALSAARATLLFVPAARPWYRSATLAATLGARAPPLG